MNKKILLDTSVLIPFYNGGRFSERLLPYTETTFMHFCSVSINEFIRGAHDTISKEIAKEFLELCGDQLITPTKKHWLECGEISEKLLKQRRRSKTNVLLLQNDILIALCARDAQLTLITADKKDFKLIQRYTDFLAEYWTG